MIIDYIRSLFATTATKKERRSQQKALALSIIDEGEISGRRLRKRLAEQGVNLWTASFYSMMANLEDEGLVEGWYRDFMVRNIPARERMYRR